MRTALRGWRAGNVTWGADQGRERLGFALGDLGSSDDGIEWRGAAREPRCNAMRASAGSSFGDHH
jgi:hypothetical protein